MRSVIIVTLVTISIGRTYIMKPLLISFVIFNIIFNVFALPQGPPPELQQQTMMLIERCSKQTGADPTQLTPEKMAAETAEEEVKCFHACMSKAVGIMNEDGTINKEGLLTFPPDMPQDLKEVLKSMRAPCVDLSGDNECETAFLLFKCMSKPPPGSQQ